MMNYLLLVIVPMLIGLWAQSRVGGTFRRFAAQPSSSGMTGAQVARAILDRNGLSDVEVRAVPGELSDHYDPRTRTVNLSEPVFAERSVAAVSVAAHEVGHAIQHANGYVPMTVRATLVPVANLGSTMLMPLFLIGVMLLWMQLVIGMWAIVIGVGLYAFAVLFHIVTLPVEFNASRRAKAQLSELALVSSSDAAGASSVLTAAALTYVAAALAALGQLMYFALAFLGNRD